MENIKFGEKSDILKNLLSILGIVIVTFLYLAFKCLVSDTNYTNSYFSLDILGYIFLLSAVLIFLLLIHLFRFFKNNYQYEFTNDGIFFRGPFTKEKFINWTDFKSFQVVAIRGTMPAIMLYVKDKDIYEKNLSLLAKRSFNYNTKRGYGEIGFVYSNMNGKYNSILSFI